MEKIKCPGCGKPIIPLIFSFHSTPHCPYCMSELSSNKDKVIDEDNKLKRTEEDEELYKKSSKDNNDSNSLYDLGLMYFEGDGVKQNLEKGVLLWEKSAEMGNYYAMHNLGCAYCNGEGVQQNYNKAHFWYKKASDCGNERSMHNLGLMYSKGSGVEQDCGKAVSWYEKSADKGYALSMYNLGLMYKNGKGNVAQNTDKSQFWFVKAAENGDDFAITQLVEAGVYKRCAICKEVIKNKDVENCPNCGESFSIMEKMFDGMLDGDGNLNEFTQNSSGGIMSQKEVLWAARAIYNENKGIEDEEIIEYFKEERFCDMFAGFTRKDHSEGGMLRKIADRILLERAGINENEDIPPKKSLNKDSPEKYHLYYKYREYFDYIHEIRSVGPKL